MDTYIQTDTSLPPSFGVSYIDYHDRHYDPPYSIEYQYQLHDQQIRFDHFCVEFCPILDKMTIYRSLHLYCKSSAKYLTIFHCKERMAWIEV